MIYQVFSNVVIVSHGGGNITPDFGSSPSKLCETDCCTDTVKLDSQPKTSTGSCGCCFWMAVLVICLNVPMSYPWSDFSVSYPWSDFSECLTPGVTSQSVLLLE